MLVWLLGAWLLGWGWEDHGDSISFGEGHVKLTHEGGGACSQLLELTRPLQFSTSVGRERGDREGREEHVGSMQRA